MKLGDMGDFSRYNDQHIQSALRQEPLMSEEMLQKPESIKWVKEVERSKGMRGEK